MTGKQLKRLRKDSGMTLKKFYEIEMGYGYYTIGLNMEKFAEIPVEAVERLKKAKFITNGAKK
jgi:hypothetical protein